MRLDKKNRCCGKKPLDYKSGREGPHKFCDRCDRAYDRETGEQIENWAWVKDGEEFRKKGIKAFKHGRFFIGQNTRISE